MIGNELAKIIHNQYNFVIGENPNERFISKTYAPQRVLVNTAEGNTFQVWTPHILAMRDEVGCVTYLHASASSWFHTVWPLYWPNIFEDGKVCYAAPDVVPSTFAIPEYQLDLYSDPGFTIDSMVSEFFVSKYHYFDFGEDYIPYKLRFAWDYWCKEDYWDQYNEEECPHGGYRYDCSDCEEEDSEGIPENELGMYMVDTFFEKLESLSKLESILLRPHWNQITARSVLQSTLRNYWYYVQRICSDRKIFTDAAEMIFNLLPSPHYVLGDETVMEIQDRIAH